MKFRFAAVCLLLIMAWLEFSTLSVTSPTVDEPLHIVRGYAFVARGEDRLRLRGPVLSNALSGMALLLEPNLKLPLADDPIWLDRDGTALPATFIWSNTAPALQMVYLARLPIIFASLILGAFVFRWSMQRSGSWPALGAMALYTFCPNILAHARVATTDVVTACTFFASAYVFHEAIHRSQRRWWLLSGVMLGLALAAKFTAVVLIPVMLLEAAVMLWRTRTEPHAWRAPLSILLITLGVGALTVWGIYRFKIGPLDSGGLVLPAPSYWSEWQALNEYLVKPLPGYLFGEISTRGWWYYYPITFVLKTPLPALIALVFALGLILLRRVWLKNLSILLPPMLLLLSLLLSPHDLGYRYLLPVLPFLFVASADFFALAKRARWLKLGALILIGWQVIGTLDIYPYYFAFFNELAGSPEHGRYLLSDSNLDWGQDLVGLKTYVDQNHITNLNLSYFGNTDPAVYGLHAYALPPVRSAMNQQGVWWLHRYYPPAPAPGTYAISVANLMGGIWNSQSDFAYFRTAKPDAIIGHTIYVYTVPAQGTSIDLSLAGLQIDQIDPATYQRFQSNDVRPRWFEATSSVIAAPDRSWIALAADQPLAPELRSLFADVEPIVQAQTIDDQRPYKLYNFDLGPRILQAAQQSEQTAQTITLPVKFGDTAELIGYNIAPTLSSASGLTLTTYWRAGTQVITPLQMFVHVLRSDGSIAAQVDRLDASPFGWRSGDLIAQVHYLSIPAGPQTYTIEIGLYNSDSGERVPVLLPGREIDQRLILKQFTIP